MLRKMLALIMPGIVAGLVIYYFLPVNQLLIPYEPSLHSSAFWYLRDEHTARIFRPAMIAIMLTALLVEISNSCNFLISVRLSTTIIAQS